MMLKCPLFCDHLFLTTSPSLTEAQQLTLSASFLPYMHGQLSSGARKDASSPLDMNFLQTVNTGYSASCPPWPSLSLCTVWLSRFPTKCSLGWEGSMQVTRGG